MKKFLAVAMVAIMTVCAAGCSSSSSNSGDKSDEKQEEADNESEGDDVSGEGSVLRMGCSADFPPFEYYDDDAQTIVGFEVDMMEEVCKRNGMTLEVQDMNFDSVVTAVQTGKIDVGVSGITITEEREESVNFSDYYFVAAQSILVPKESEVTGYQQLLDGDFTVGVQLGTTGDIMAVEKLGDRVSQFEKYGDALAAMLAGKVDCMVLDTGVAEAFAAANDLVVLEENFGTEEDAEYYGIAIAKENTELLDTVNATLAEMKDDGFFDELTTKYFG